MPNSEVTVRNQQGRLFHEADVYRIPARLSDGDSRANTGDGQDDLEEALSVTEEAQSDEPVEGAPIALRKGTRNAARPARYLD
ncbi:hypothetical protein Ciccas_014529 [Cichlidogyrus casuarinus]|uniref:Uncharacterized protein n=1 Tax=Cichlidogyrus casuarinus TaxID=1844966 RepID=A0ABD2PK56_9PLAT